MSQTTTNVRTAPESNGSPTPATETASAAPAPPTADSGWGAVAFVWGAWVVMLLFALAFVVRYGRNVPYCDDWIVIPYATGEAPITAAWFWELFKEHRVPLAKLVLLGLLKLSGCDVRAGMFFCGFALGALALAMILVARSVRGRTSYFDAFFPLALLHLGHYQNLLWCWQVNYILPLAFASIFLLVVVKCGQRLTTGAGLLAGVCLLLLPFSSGVGVAFVPALALWLGYVAVASWRSGEQPGRRIGLLLLALTLASLLVVGLYFIGYENPYPSAYKPDLKSILRTTSQFLTMGFGQATLVFGEVLGPALVALLAVSAGLLASVWLRRPQERSRALGLFVFLGALSSLALATSLGRQVASPRHAILVAPLWCCVYYIWELYSPPRVRFFVQMCLLLAIASMFSLNVQAGLEWGNVQCARLEAFQQDLRAGTPTFVLLGRHTDSVRDRRDQDELAEMMRMLRKAGVSQFQALRDDPPFREIPFAVVPTACNQLTWEGKKGHGTGKDGYLVFSLPEPRFVGGVRIKIRYDVPAASSKLFGATLRMAWGKSAKGNLPAEYPFGQLLYLRPEQRERTVMVWIGDTIDRFRLRPDDRPCDFEIEEMTLLVPAAEQVSPSSGDE